MWFSIYICGSAQKGGLYGHRHHQRSTIATNHLLEAVKGNEKLMLKVLLGLLTNVQHCSIGMSGERGVKQWALLPWPCSWLSLVHFLFPFLQVCLILPHSEASPLFLAIAYHFAPPSYNSKSSLHFICVTLAFSQEIKILMAFNNCLTLHIMETNALDLM